MHHLQVHSKAQALAQFLRGMVGAGRPPVHAAAAGTTAHNIRAYPAALSPLLCDAQVRSKAQALAQFLQGMAGAGRAYTLLQLARRLLSYCEAQVALSHPSAFPLAEVTAAVLAAHPDLAPILLGKLYEVSAYTAWCMAWHGLVHPGVAALEELALLAHATPACARYAWRCSLGGAADSLLTF